MFRIAALSAGVFFSFGCAHGSSSAFETDHPAVTPVEVHGQLSAKGNRIVGEHGNPVSLAGLSWFWSTTGWGQERFYNPDAVQFVADDWNASIVRAAVSVEPEGGYLTDPEPNIRRAEAIIDGAIEAGIYVLIDWHAHRAENHPDAAIEFFTTMAKTYGDEPNVIYEIYNEPLKDADWSTVIKPYAETVIAAIREIDPDNLIIVGTQTWSQDVDKAAADPITGFDNLAYTLHFYAGTHGDELRQKARTALDAGIALMVTEYGTVNANGDGAVATENTEAWMNFMRENKLSHLNWSVADKNEGASLLKPNASSTGDWSDKDLSESGLYVRDIVRNWSVEE